MKNPFKSNKKKEKFPTQQVPRPAQEIQAEYNDLAMKAGGAAYEIKVREANLNDIQSRMAAVQNEAFARKNLDAAAAAATKAEAKSE